MRAVLFSATSRRVAGWLLGILLLLAGRPELARASHIRAGDIQAKVDTTAAHNPNRIFFKLTLYVDPTTFDQQKASIYFGDGTKSAPTDRMPATPIRVPGRTDTQILTFYFDHTYPGPRARAYDVSFVGENRVNGVLNINNGSSSGETFYIRTSVIIDPGLGLNHSAVLRAPAVDQGNIGQVYLHNPAGYDADGDSLAYLIRQSYQVQGGESAADQLGNDAAAASSVCTNYVYPNAVVPNAPQVTYPGLPTQVPGSTAFFRQDARTGQVTWNAPARAGYYNVAMTVEEWRRYPSGIRRRIGIVVRDYQILINNSNNLPPRITTPDDVCAIAGQPLTLVTTATDQVTASSAPASPVTLFAYSGILPPATFTTVATGTTTTGTFRWTPDCSNVASEPYNVLFKAQDNPSSPSASNPILIDEKLVRITVIGPAPRNLAVVRAANQPILTGELSWAAYVCSNATSILIYRRENPSNWQPGSCETGIPASAGYQLVGTVPASATSFRDDNAGRGLTMGSTYCYRIYAVFPLPAGGASIASAEACFVAPGRPVRVTNVDVNTTNATTGQLTVKWTRPRNEADGYTFPAPAGYRLVRAEGTSNNYAQVFATTNLTDTTFVDTGRNTAGVQYNYKVVFYRTDGGTEVRDSTAKATSVRTTIVPNGQNRSIAVSWAYQVPWDNTRRPSEVYRSTGSGPFARVATITPGATSGSYTDANLQLGETYCYYVRTVGQYVTPLNSAGLPIYDNLLNNSQQTCVTLRPVPCTPVLSIRAVNCDSLAGRPQYPEPNQRFQNQLTWTVSNTPGGCQNVATTYRVLRADTEAGPFAQIGLASGLTYLDPNLTQQNYCYQVQGVSADGDASTISNVACQSECTFFVLPNIFIPGSSVTANQTFRPKTTSPITRTRIQIFNRWGRKVYESDKDPYINWTGGGKTGDSGAGDLAASGIYYYLAEVEFANSTKTQKVYKGWVELVR